jgi:DNA-binding response OmpR family regulator
MTLTKILVIDDHQDTLDAIRHTLESAGYAVVTALDGLTGLRLAVAEKPDLIVLDVIMPGMNGLAVCRHLQSTGSTANIPVLLLAEPGQQDADDAASINLEVRAQLRSLDIGAGEFLNKPIDEKELVRRVKALLWLGGKA